MKINRKRHILKSVYSGVFESNLFQTRLLQARIDSIYAIKNAVIKIQVVKKWQSLILSLFMSLTLTACSVSPEADVTDNSVSVMDDLSIAKALYFDKRIPDDFYRESEQEQYASISHVKNVAILPPHGRSGLSVYELSSQNYTEALVLDEQATTYQPLYSQLVDNDETDMYYQFMRVNPDLPNFVDISRVFKASVLDRAGVDRSIEEGEYQGRITLTNIQPSDVKHVVEYLWMFSFSNNYSNAVLESYTTETSDEFIHIMQQAKIHFNFSGSCDQIETYEIRHSVDKVSGLIWRDKIEKHQFLANREGSFVELCQ